MNGNIHDRGLHVLERRWLWTAVGKKKVFGLRWLARVRALWLDTFSDFWSRLATGRCLSGAWHDKHRALKGIFSHVRCLYFPLTLLISGYSRKLWRLFLGVKAPPRHLQLGSGLGHQFLAPLAKYAFISCNCANQVDVLLFHSHLRRANNTLASVTADRGAQIVSTFSYLPWTCNLILLSILFGFLCSLYFLCFRCFVCFVDFGSNFDVFFIPWLISNS